ncbi:MAG: hypothetical protein EA419_02005 [Wenzhouxiangella sp.]|nr:MAG: hypothetical protein EA419_02005 [Wenzhouxiangella sp.]
MRAPTFRRPFSACLPGPAPSTIACCVALVLALSPPSLLAASPSGCDDLGAFPETPGLVFERDIQPLLDNCLGCHGGQGGLSLAPDEAYKALVGVVSNTRPELLRVDPGKPGQSVLFRAINCNTPAGPSFRMPGLSGPTDQALIRDWIEQGAGDFILRDRFEPP